MGKSYYCIVAGLPDMSLDDSKPTYSMDRLKDEIYPQLSAHDKGLIDLALLQVDNRNLLALMNDKHATTEKGGLLTGEALLEMIEAVRQGDVVKGVPGYMMRFVEQYDAMPADSLFKADDLLWGLYYEQAMQADNKFVASWFEFNLNLNNMLSALAARKYKMDVAQVVVGNTETAELIRTSNARDFDLGNTLDYVDAVLQIAATDNLVAREQMIDRLRWKWMDEATVSDYFSVERIFVFMMQIAMTSRWMSLDKDTGNEKFRQIIAQLKNEVKVPTEY
ncbi:MAG: DUF2764 family protein [Bacteroidales bacterium]|nr:DUF2764 family protein [Bacteroidales bacterium]